MSISEVQVVVADTAESRLLHYQLRYQVFCLETRFEDASNHPDGQEKDQFDDHAQHFLVRSKHAETWLATARIILPGDSPLPIERHCHVHRDSVPFEQMAEFSRLLISTQVRRRRQGAVSRRSVGRPSRSPMCSDSAWMLVKLFHAMAAYGLERGIPGAAFFITPALARILTRMKIELTAIGEPCQHRGLRFPYATDAKQVFEALSRFIEVRGEDGEPCPYRLFSELPSTEGAQALNNHGSDLKLAM